MRKSMDRSGRGTVCALAALALPTVLSAVLSSAAAPPPTEESARIPFAARYHATQHGGITRAANSSVTCGPPSARATERCAAVQEGGAGANGRYRMTYIDVDADTRTDNSSRAELQLPPGSHVSYARLYWGGNLRAGEQKRAGDSGRVLLAAPGGPYKEVRADTLTGHRTTTRTDGFQASADVTGAVREGGAGAYTVGQVNAARGNSAAGGWGGWTLVVAYANAREPLRRLALWDGFQPLNANRRALSVNLKGLRIPPNARGSAGVLAYNGDRGIGNDSLSAAADDKTPIALWDAANPANDVMNSTIADFGRDTPRRPAYRNTLGFDSDVFDLKSALRSGGDRLAFRFTTQDAGYLLGALFVQADTGR
ncbi:hypothetical protein [Streptomyces sp. NPDC101150]|uniref:hypothetical protein n=1 Tax=Streptomyces sp. NPDC101150 TaxID=3366114 RepID=UPI0037FDFF34